MVAGAGSDFFPILVQSRKTLLRGLCTAFVKPHGHLAGSGSVFYALQGGFEDNSEKLEEGEFAHMQKQNYTCIPLIE